MEFNIMSRVFDVFIYCRVLHLTGAWPSMLLKSVEVQLSQIVLFHYHTLLNDAFYSIIHLMHGLNLNYT